MTTMIERVAIKLMMNRQPGTRPSDLKRYPSAIRDARAAIEEMREPTPAMLFAGMNHAAHPGNTLKAMIDAALNEKEAA